MDVRQLVEAAACKVGSDYRLSQELGVSRSLVSEWKAGKRPCPVPQQAAMADIAGIDVERVIAEAIIEQTRGTARGERLARALSGRLGKALTAWAAGAVAMLAVFGAAEPAHAAGGLRLSSENVYYVKLKCKMMCHCALPVSVGRARRPHTPHQSFLRHRSNQPAVPGVDLSPAEAAGFVLHTPMYRHMLQLPCQPRIVSTHVDTQGADDESTCKEVGQ